MAADTQIQKGSLVSLNATGFAVEPVDDDGFDAYGVAQAYVDNRTGSEAGGTAGDADVEVFFGAYGFDISGTTPLPGEILYVVDNQTVSTSSGTTRGVAGPCIEVRDVYGVAQAFVYVGPQARKT